MDRKSYRQARVKAKQNSEAEFLEQLRSIRAQNLQVRLPSSLVHDFVLDTGETIIRGLGRVQLEDGSFLDPVLFLPANLDPRLLWYPALTYLFDNTSAEPFHTTVPEVIPGGRVVSVQPSPYTLPHSIILQLQGRMGVAGLGIDPLEVSCQGVYGFGLESNVVFADWGNYRGADVDSASGREPLAPHRLQGSRDFVGGVPVVLGEFRLI